MNIKTTAITVGPALAEYPPGTSFGPRTLTDFELVWLRRGRARWQATRPGPGQQGGENTLAFPLAPGDLLLIPPGTTDEFRWDRDTPTSHGYVHFEADGPLPAVPSFHRGRPHGPAEGLLEFLLWLGEARLPGWRDRAAELVTVLVRLLVAGPLPGPERPEPTPLAAALDHVRSQWAVTMRPLPLAELAAAAHVSPSYLTRLFRDRFGRAPGAGLELVRLERARTLLGRSTMNVTEVAAACGYTDPLHFSRRFRAVYGVAPSTCRANPATAVPPDMPSLPALRRRLTP
jgi:AraC family transcriptional regulator